MLLGMLCIVETTTSIAIVSQIATPSIASQSLALAMSVRRKGIFG